MKNYILPTPTEETPHVIKDYPYGFRERTEMLIWIEKDKKGIQSRVCRQTKNPKTNRLNKPKKSVYSDLFFLYTDSETGHVQSTGYDFFDSVERMNTIHNHLMENGLNQHMTQTEKNNFIRSLYFLQYQSFPHRKYSDQTRQEAISILAKNKVMLKDIKFEKIFDEFVTLPPDETGEKNLIKTTVTHYNLCTGQGETI